MRKETTFLLGVLAMLLINPVFGQEKSDQFKPSGKVYATVFSNVHGGLMGDDNSSAFEITQAYFGYKYNISEHFSADVKLDIGDPVETAYSKLKRYAYFKLAQLQYKQGHLTMRFGVIGMKQFKYQEKFWTRKFVKKTFQDYYGYGPSADIGAAIAYDFLPNLKVEGLLMNGEGYKDLQNDDTYKAGLGVTYKPIKNLHVYLYSDFAKKIEWATSNAIFIGYKTKKYSLGYEYNRQDNVDYDLTKSWEGMSAYASYALAEKWELFARYDMLTSSTPENASEGWNASSSAKPYPKSDGDYLIGGVQFTPVSKVKIAVDIQHYTPTVSTENPQLFGFLHFQFDL